MTHPHPEKDFSTDETAVEETGQEQKPQTVEEALSDRNGLKADEADETPVSVEEPAVAEETPALDGESEPAHGDSDVAAEEETHVDEETAPVVEDEPSPVKENRSPVLPLVCLGVGLLAGFLGQYAVNGVHDIIKAQNSTVFTTAVSDCNLEKRDGVTLSSNGKTLTIDTKGAKDDSGASEQNAGCVFQALSIPKDVKTKVATTKMDSPQQSANWDDKTITWEFSTDHGIQLEFKINS